MIIVYTLPVDDEDGEITGCVGALLVAPRELRLVDGDSCDVGYCVRDVGAIKDGRYDWRKVSNKPGAVHKDIEEYRRHLVTHSLEPYQPVFEVWERVA